MTDGLWVDYNDGTWPACCTHSNFDIKKVCISKIVKIIQFRTILLDLEVPTDIMSFPFLPLQDYNTIPALEKY